MINEIEFGKRLEEIMKNKGYTNTKLTEMLKVSKNAVGNYKNGQIPNAIILYKISQILGTTVEYLLTGKDDTENLTEKEKEILIAYRQADPAEQSIIRKILDIPENIEKSFNSKIG